MKVLLIDDSDTYRAMIRQILHNLGIAEIHEVNDGGQALIYLGGHLAELIIVDWEMPNISGVQVLKAIRQYPKTSKIPVIMCTTNADPNHLVAAAEAGVSGYIVKPFNEDTFEKKLKELGLI